MTSGSARALRTFAIPAADVFTLQSMNPPIPDGLPELLQDFTVEVLRCKPPNLVEFAATYFHELREKSKTGGLCSAESGASVAPISDEETGENGQVDDGRVAFLFSFVVWNVQL